MRMLLAVLSALTCLVSAWMCVMFLVLGHPGFLRFALISAVVCGGAAGLVTGRPLPSLRAPLGAWAVLLAAFGAWMLVAPSDDGWVLVAGALFVVEGLVAAGAMLLPVRHAQ